MSGPDGWAAAKRRHLDLLAAARAEGATDAAIDPLLDLLNASEDLVTTSSCAGRVQVLSLPRPGAKEDALVLGRWHEPPFDVPGALDRASDTRLVTLLAEPPILHVLCRDLEAARRVRDLGERGGFKRSVVRTLSPDTILVEIAGTDRLEAPLADRSGRLPSDAVAFLSRHAADTFERGRLRLRRLQAAAKELK